VSGGGNEKRTRRFNRVLAAVSAYCAQCPVFRTEELDAAIGVRDPDARLQRTRVLQKLVARGAIVRLMRRTYIAVERGDYASTGRRARPLADMYAAAARMKPDAVLAFRTAFEIYGALPARPGRPFLYLSRIGGSRLREWGGVQGLAIEHAAVLLRTKRWRMGTAVVRRGDATVRVTTRERTLVDALDRWEQVGSWGEIVVGLRRLIEGHRIDWEEVVAYAKQLGRGTTAARVGWYLEQGLAWNRVPASALAALERMRPRGPVYWDWTDRRCGAAPGQYSTRWNIVVPRAVVAWCDGRRPSRSRDCA
jgi:predicted transcriptional regulator of viral defense system